MHVSVQESIPDKTAFSRSAPSRELADRSVFRFTPTRCAARPVSRQKILGDLMSRFERFTEYAGSGGKSGARMLYDHEEDPLEDVNVAEHQTHQKRIRQLAEKLHQGMGKDRSGAEKNNGN